MVQTDSSNRKVTLHTVNGDLEYYGKLTELSEQVGDGFYRTHRAYLVNLDYVEKYDGNTVKSHRQKYLPHKIFPV